MKIAVLADVHDNIWNLKKVLADLKKRKAEAIVFCGDIGSPVAAKILAGADLPTYAVFGNVDGAQFEIVSWVKDQAPQMTLGKEMLAFELGGKKLAICHYPELSRGLASTGDYDAIFYGHLHKARQEKVGQCLLLNPGEVMGKTKCSWAIYDTKTNQAEIIDVS